MKIRGPGGSGPASVCCDEMRDRITLVDSVLAVVCVGVAGQELSRCPFIELATV
jgi:hypothetical protein